jgi:hypothetical protein
VPGGITGPQSLGDRSGQKCRYIGYIVLLVGAVGGLDGRLTTLLCKQITVTDVTEPKEVKTGCNLAETFKDGYGSKRVVLPIVMMMI